MKNQLSIIALTTFLTIAAQASDNMERFDNTGGDHAAAAVTKVVIGAGGVYWGLKKAPEVAKATEEVKGTTAELDRANALVSEDVKASRITRAETAMSAASEAMDQTKGYQVAEDTMKTMNMASAMFSKDKSMFDAYLQNETADMLIDTPYEEAESRYNAAADDLNRAHMLETADPAERAKVIRSAEQKLELAQKNLESAKERYGAKGGTKALKTVALVAGGVALTDLVVQVGSLAVNGTSANLSPMSSWIINKVEAKVPEGKTLASIRKVEVTTKASGF